MSSRFRKEESKWILDVRGFTGPYSVIYTRRALSSINEGEILEVIIDNPPLCETVPMLLDVLRKHLLFHYCSFEFRVRGCNKC